MKVKVKKIREGAIIPKYQTKGAACFDVHAIVSSDNKNYRDMQLVWHGDLGADIYQKNEECEPHILVPPQSQAIIPTGLVFQVPEGYYLDIRPRSGLAAKKCITITNSPGTLDEDYCGPKDELCIILFNLGKEDFIVKQGDRIAQCKVERVERAELEEVNEVGEVSRGGLGSTGI